MSTEANKAVTRGFFEAFDRGDIEGAKAFVSPDVTTHYPGVPGPMNFDAFVALGEAFLAGFPGMSSTIEDQIAVDDWVVTRQTFTGVNSGSFQGIPPTGKRFTAGAITIDRVVDGKICERWVEFDQLGLLQQLGVIPSMAPAS